MEEEIAQLKKIVLDLKAEVEQLKSIMPKVMQLSEIAKSLGISRQALKYHLENYYKEKEDFYKQNGKIYISVGVIPNIKRHYGN